MVTEARERQKAGVQPGPDTWRVDLDPRTAARARTIPILKNEREELKKRLAEVSHIHNVAMWLPTSKCSSKPETTSFKAKYSQTRAKSNLMN